MATTAWDLVVIDEAHRLRNVYKPGNVIANTLKMALKERRKLLLTATPLQNSLLELFGLVSIIDQHTFGDLKSFREQFANLSQEHVFKTLKERLKPVCQRTLRRQVIAYIPYTRRWPLLEEFTPEESEDRLYEVVSEYLRRPNLQALPASQRSLMTLVLRKLLASSTFAIAGALSSISQRLKDKIKKQEPAETVEEELEKDYEALDETAEEWSEDEPSEPLTDADRQARTVLDHDGAVAIEDGAPGSQHGDGAQTVVVGLSDVLLGRQDLQEPQAKDDDPDEPDGDGSQQQHAQGDRRRLRDLVAAAGADPAALPAGPVTSRICGHVAHLPATSAPRGTAAPPADSPGRAAE